MSSGLLFIRPKIPMFVLTFVLSFLFSIEHQSLGPILMFRLLSEDLNQKQGSEIILYSMHAKSCQGYP